MISDDSNPMAGRPNLEANERYRQMRERDAEVGNPRPWQYPPLVGPGDRVGAALADGTLRIDTMPDEYPLAPVAMFGDLAAAVMAACTGTPVPALDWVGNGYPIRMIPDLEDALRAILGIPPGFPLWYRTERLALPVGPIGRAIMWARETCTVPYVYDLAEANGGAPTRRDMLDEGRLRK